ncbi:MAG: MotA/TolQ/ExbB proton channel family protein [Pirellulaceae bacterium]|nr:MotA/TolQ/ExbB proton channel family protein [Pirellulaceae bacterium]
MQPFSRSKNWDSDCWSALYDIVARRSAVIILCALCISSGGLDFAQLSCTKSSFAQEGGSLSEAELQRYANQAAAAPAKPVPNAGLDDGLSFLSLVIKGGVLMIPLGILSLLVVAMTLDRFIALRRERILPSRIRRGIDLMLESGKPIEPQEVYQLALRYPSAAARVLEGMLQKVGRPVVELESATTETCQREADRMYHNVRWLSLATTVAPLMGLLGTVWGMIIAFYNTTQLGTGKNKSEFLAEGIYIAFINTLGGLAVAIPAVIFAYYFEGRITNLMGRVEEQVRRLIPRFERYEGKVRYDLQVQGLVARDRPPATSGRPAESARPIPPPPHSAARNS